MLCLLTLRALRRTLLEHLLPEKNALEYEELLLFAIPTN